MNDALPLLFPVVRGLILGTLLLLTGCAATTTLVRRHHALLSPSTTAKAQLWLLILPRLLATFLLALCLARSAAQLLSFMSPGETIDPDFAKAVLIQGPWGTANLIESVTALLLFGATTLLRTKPRGMGIAVLVALPLLLGAESGLGHGAEESWPSLLGRMVHLLHLAGGGIWLGSLGVLAVALLPALIQRQEWLALAAVLRTFSLLARVGATLIVVTGLTATLHYGVSVDVAIHSSWGQLLLLKLLAFVGVLLLGWWNWRVVTPAVQQELPGSARRLHRAVIVELMLGFLMLVVTALLVGAPLPQTVEPCTAEGTTPCQPTSMKPLPPTPVTPSVVLR